jgi:ABC-type lipoprotein export system ATPase subunit
MGPSGSGKSTLLNVIGMLDRPSKGTVEISGQGVGALSDRQLAAKRNLDIGFVFQTFHLIQDLNVLDNVEIPLLYRQLPAGRRRTMAQEALERVGLSARTRTSRPSSREASGSVSPSRAPSSAGRAFCSPMNRPGISTARWATRSSPSSRS